MTCWEVNIDGKWRWTSAEMAACAVASDLRSVPGLVRLADVPRSPAIRFRRLMRVPANSGITGRRLAASRRALVAEQLRQGGPMFAHLVAQTQPTPEQRIEQIDRQREQDRAEWRKRTADQWREGRRLLRQQPPEARDLIVHAWNASTYPPTSEWFLMFMKRKAQEILT